MFMLKDLRQVKVSGQVIKAADLITLKGFINDSLTRIC